MTIDEAIKHCEEVAACNTEQGKCPECAEQHKQLAEWLRELVTLRTQAYTPPNDLLMLEELREMGKDWVWIELKVPLYGMETGYYLKKPQFSDTDKFCCGYPDVVVRDIQYSGYGDIWSAYRRRPEEAAP